MLLCVCAGVLDSMEREECVDLIKSYGGKVTGGVSGKTSYLIAGTDPGESKVKKAGEKGTKVIDEDGLFEIIKKSGPPGGSSSGSGVTGGGTSVAKKPEAAGKKVAEATSSAAPSAPRAAVETSATVCVACVVCVTCTAHSVRVAGPGCDAKLRVRAHSILLARPFHVLCCFQGKGKAVASSSDMKEASIAKSEHLAPSLWVDKVLARVLRFLRVIRVPIHIDTKSIRIATRMRTHASAKLVYKN